MDYMELVKRSVSNAWNLRFLWLFGFLVSMGDGFGNSFSWTDKLSEGEHWGGLGEYGDFTIEPAIILLVVLLLICVGFVFWLLSVFAEGAMIHGIAARETNRPVGFGDCWSVGTAKFFRLLGIMLLAILAAGTMVIGLVMFVVPAFMLSAGLGVVLALMLVPALIAAIFIVVVVEGWAIRYAVLRDVPWLDAISAGWNLFRHNIGPTLGVAFSSLVTQIIIWIGLFVGMLLLAIPFVIIGIANLWMGLIPGILLFVLIVVVSSCFFGVFSSSVWTLGFMRLTGSVAPSRDVPVAPVPPSPLPPP